MLWSNWDLSRSSHPLQPPPHPPPLPISPPVPSITAIFSPLDPNCVAREQTAQKHPKYKSAHCIVTHSKFPLEISVIFTAPSSYEKPRKPCTFPVSEEALRLEDIAWFKAWTHLTRSDTTALSNANTHGCAHIQKGCFLFYQTLAQGWPLYHNNLIHFDSLRLPLYFRVGSLVRCPFLAPLNSRSQTFCLVFFPPQFLRFFFASSAFLCVGHASFAAALMWLNVTPASTFDSIYFVLSMRTTDPSIFHSCST